MKELHQGDLFITDFPGGWVCGEVTLVTETHVHAITDFFDRKAKRVSSGQEIAYDKTQELIKLPGREKVGK